MIFCTTLSVGRTRRFPPKPRAGEIFKCVECRRGVWGWGRRNPRQDQEEEEGIIDFQHQRRSRNSIFATHLKSLALASAFLAAWFAIASARNATPGLLLLFSAFMKAKVFFVLKA
jgi:hypothetical protein